MKKTKNQWVCRSERTLLHSPLLEITEQDCHSSEDGRHHRFYVMKSRDWCNIIPITEKGNVVFVKQYRIGIANTTLEIPGGVVDGEDKTPRESAIRELLEETGYAPLPRARCVNLGWNFPNPAIQNNRCHSFLIYPVKKIRAQKLDHGEMIEVKEVPLINVPKLILKRKITHALILNAFYSIILKDRNFAELLGYNIHRLKKA